MKIFTTITRSSSSLHIATLIHRAILKLQELEIQVSYISIPHSFSIINTYIKKYGALQATNTPSILTTSWIISPHKLAWNDNSIDIVCYNSAGIICAVHKIILK